MLRYVNSFAEKKSFDAQRLLRCSWDDMTPSEEDLVREPLLRELSVWRAPSAFGSASNSAKEVGEEEGATDAGVEETKGEEGVLTETKEDTGKGERSPGGGQGIGGAQAKVGLEFDKKGGSIAARFEVLQQVNRKLRDALPYFDLTQVCVSFCILVLLLKFSLCVRGAV